MTPKEAVDIIRDAPPLTPHEQAQCADIERQAIDPLRHAPGFPRVVDVSVPAIEINALVDVWRQRADASYLVYLDFPDCNPEVFADGAVLTADKSYKLAYALRNAAYVARKLNRSKSCEAH